MRWVTVMGAVILAAALPAMGQSPSTSPSTQSGAPASSPSAPAIDLEKYRQQMMEQMRIDMQASPEEWAVLLPKIERVQSLQAAGVLLRMLNGEVLSELRSLLRSKEVTDAQLREKMETWRAAMQRNREELFRAQGELRELVTIRQEALLISRGILD